MNVMDWTATQLQGEPENTGQKEHKIVLCFCIFRLLFLALAAARATIKPLGIAGDTHSKL